MREIDDCRKKLSTAAQWIENPSDEESVKQNCERKAFIRLAAKLKKIYPRLPMIILSDGLYPYEGVLEVTVEKKQFVHMTDLPLNKKNIAASIYSGRMRWKIENEGFNNLKNGGETLLHNLSLTIFY